MSNQQPRNYRAKEIICLLKENGPLTAKAISLMVSPPMKERKFYMALGRLKKKGLIDIRTEKLIGKQCSIYQVPQDLPSRIKVANLIDVCSDDLLQPHFRYREILHNDICALVANKLKLMFPDGHIVRDFEFNKSELAQKIMLCSEDDRDLKPDVLLLFKNSMGENTISIAFEIEKTRKSNERLKAKLKKYSMQSRVDGVVYLCEEKRIYEALKNNYNAHYVHRALRVKHYSNYFLMFTDVGKMHLNKNDTLYSIDENSVPLKKWISFLRDVQSKDRRNTGMPIGADACPYDRTKESN